VVSESRPHAGRTRFDRKNYPHTIGSYIKATFKDGMLSLDIPKTEKAKPKAIEVKVE
jgi:HSP20 family molecular chaperone IbpA